MTLEQQVVSLELAQKLKELGIVAQSLYTYYQKEPGGPYFLGTWNEHTPPNVFANKNELISAFTVAELVNLLQIVAKEDIIIALDDTKVAETLANLLCTKLQSSKENVGSGLMQ